MQPVHSQLVPSYRFRVDGPIVAIEDLNGPIPVALAAEYVFHEVRQQLGSLDGRFVIWRDSLGIWDGMEYVNQQLVFYPLAADNYEEAKELLLSGEVVTGEHWVIKDEQGLRRPYDRSTWDEVHGH